MGPHLSSLCRSTRYLRPRINRGTCHLIVAQSFYWIDPARPEGRHQCRDEGNTAQQFGNQEEEQGIQRLDSEQKTGNETCQRRRRDESESEPQPVPGAIWIQSERQIDVRQLIDFGCCTVKITAA